MKGKQICNEQSRQRSTGVIISGKVIPPIGSDSAYFRQVATYIGNKIAELRQNRAYACQSSERKAQILWLNLTNDCLQAGAEDAGFGEKMVTYASEIYALKREPVEQCLRVETLQKDAKDEAAEASLAVGKQKLEEQPVATERERKSLQAEKERLTANIHYLEEGLEAEKRRNKRLEAEPDELLSK